MGEGSGRRDADPTGDGRERSGSAVARRAAIAVLLLASMVGALPATAVSGSQVNPIEVDGAALTRLVPVPPDADVHYAASDAGMYRSMDAGATWASVGPAPPDGHIVVARDDPELLLAGELPPCARGGGEEPLERSDDGGATWRLTTALGLRPLAIWAGDRLALAAGCTGLMASIDAGRTWNAASVVGDHQLASGLEVTGFALLVAPDDGATREALVVGTSEGGTSRLFRVDVTDPTAPRVGEVLREFWGLGALAGRGEVFVVGTAQGVLVSPDGGATWAASRSGLEAVTLSVDPTMELIPEEEQRRGFGIKVLAIDPTEPTRLYAGTVGGLFVSDDAGATWTRIDGVEGTVAEIVLMPGAARLLAQTDGGVVVVPIEG